MKSFKDFIFEYLRLIKLDKEFDIEIGNHGDERKNRGIESNFKINFTKITDKEIKLIISKFSNKIKDKISNGTLVCKNPKFSIQLIDYNFTICIYLSNIINDKYVIGVKSVWPTDDDFGTYESKYKKYNRDSNKIFISNIKK